MNNPDIEQLKIQVSVLEARIAALSGGSSEALDHIQGRLLPEATQAPGGAFFVRGDKVLYKQVSLREYDENNNLVAVGSETGTTPDSVDAGHSIKPTWDWTRLEDD